MKAKLGLVPLAISLALAGAACSAKASPTPSEGPSQFLTGLSLPAILTSINATPNGPRCLNAPPDIALSHEPRDSTFGGWSTAGLTTSCDDPGDGTALAQAWAAGITTELNRLGASETMKGVSTTATGAKFTDEWEYLSSGLRGQITVRVLPAPEGHYWVIMRIFEPS
jgi:hypothetical protein